MSEMLAVINKTRRYLDYVEGHYKNVQRAWGDVQEKCGGMRFVSDDFVWGLLDAEIKCHDLSKMSVEEFVPFRRNFYPTEFESRHKVAPDNALAHHQDHNPHHWQNWTNMGEWAPYDREINCVHMVIDWIAMSYKFGGTARKYYEANKHEIHLPNWAVVFINEIFDLVYD